MTDRDYFRGDQRAGITPPDLSKQCEFSEHVVRARGRKTAYTSVSLDKRSIEPFGECDYLLLRDAIAADKHSLVEHEQLMQALEKTARERDKAERLTALQAMRYARRRKEGLISWQFDISRIDRKALINWAGRNIQAYFRKC